MTLLNFEQIADGIRQWIIYDSADDAEYSLASLIDAFSADEVLWASFKKEVEDAIKDFNED